MVGRLFVAICNICLVVSVCAGPTHEEIQWEEFSKELIEFSGLNWRAKSGGPFGPGNNYFSDSEENVWVDDGGRLHLRITQRDGTWYCPEIVCVDSLGYGDYVFKTVGRVDQLDPHVILGLFLWEYQEGYESNHVHNGANEFDIEFGTWKDPSRPSAQFVCQPWQTPGNEHRFKLQLHADDERASHAFLWTPSGMACRSWLGHDDHPQDSMITHTWFYAGKDNPRLEAPRIHMNFWCIDEPPSDLKEHEVIIAEFKFLSACPQPDSEDRPSPRWMFWR